MMVKRGDFLFLMQQRENFVMYWVLEVASSVDEMIEIAFLETGFSSEAGSEGEIFVIRC